MSKPARHMNVVAMIMDLIDSGSGMSFYEHFHDDGNDENYYFPKYH
jgi:hypothetical protein